MAAETIELILTGGRMEKILNEETGRLIYTDSIFNMIIEQTHCTLRLHKHKLMLKDSCEINDVDLEAIADCCAYTTGKHVLVAHGITTLGKTARYLQGKEIQKTIVLFGAFVPFSQKNSDALFNFGAATAAVQLLPHGVYVAMNGEIIKADEVALDEKSERFLALPVPVN